MILIKKNDGEDCDGDVDSHGSNDGNDDGDDSGNHYNDKNITRCEIDNHIIAITIIIMTIIIRRIMIIIVIVIIITIQTNITIPLMKRITEWLNNVEDNVQSNYSRPNSTHTYALLKN